MNQDELKRQVGQTAVEYVEEDSILGVGTGSTVNAFIDALAASGKRLEAGVSQSKRMNALSGDL